MTRTTPFGPRTAPAAPTATAARFRTRRALPIVAALAAAALAIPGNAAAQSYAIVGGTVHTLAGETFEGAVVIADGHIAAVGPEVRVPEGAEVVDATDRHVYPAMFDAVSALGLTEIGAVDVTNDMREQGDFNPHLQAATAIHPASEHIPVARANGIALTMTAPRGGTVAGQASLIGLDGWTVEEMLVEPGAAMVVNFPSLGGGGGFRYGRRVRGGGGDWPAARKRHREAVDRLDAWLDAARWYDRAVRAGVDLPRDLGNEAMAKVASRAMPVLLAANGERDIRNAVEWARRQELRFVITGGREAWKVADLLAENGVGVILSPTQAMPSGPDAPYYEAYANPGRLHAAGVRIAFATFGSSDSRTLPYEAAQAVPYGLPREAALAAVTRNTADMLGFGDRIGTIEAGRIANVMITDGDPLEIRTRVTGLFVFGRAVDLANRHRSLYERYRARPGGRSVP